MIAKFALSLAVLLTVQSQPAIPTSLSLADAELTAFEFNPQLKVSQLGQTIAKSKFVESRTQLLPKVIGNESFAYSNNPLFVAATKMMQHRFQVNNLQFNSLNHPPPTAGFFTSAFVTVPILHHLDTYSQIGKKKLEWRASSSEQERTAQLVRYQIISSYYGVVVAGAVKDLAADSIKMADADLKRIESLRRNGQIVQSDVLSMQVQLADFEKMLAQAEGDQVTANYELNLAMGTPEAKEHILSGKLTEHKFHMEDLPQLIEKALSTRQDLLQSNLKVRASRQEVKKTVGAYLPKADGFAGIIQSGDALVNGGTSFILGGSLTYDFLDPGRRERIKQARAYAQMANHELELARNNVRLEVVRAREDFLVAQAKLKVSEREVAQSQESLRIIRNRYKAGLTTITELIRAQNAYVKLQTDYLSSSYEYLLAYARVRLASGSLVSVGEFE